ncbi:MAG TPA: hypothetical protein VLK65_28630 [Vicinamibacteria bacterium]|nr:hypothetical protein [Vicinamibacteria bacterium]
MPPSRRRPRRTAHVVVHFTEEAGKKTAHSIKVISDKSTSVLEGTVSQVDGGTQTVAVKLKDGTTETVHLAKDGLVACGRGVEPASEVNVPRGRGRRQESPEGRHVRRRLGHPLHGRRGRRIAHSFHELGESSSSQ